MAGIWFVAYTLVGFPLLLESEVLIAHPNGWSAEYFIVGK